MSIGEHHDRTEEKEERDGADDETGEGGAHVGAMRDVGARGPVGMCMRVSHGEVGGTSYR